VCSCALRDTWSVNWRLTAIQDHRFLSRWNARISGSFIHIHSYNNRGNVAPFPSYVGELVKIPTFDRRLTHFDAIIRGWTLELTTMNFGDKKSAWSLYRIWKPPVRVLNRFGVVHGCDRQTDVQNDDSNGGVIGRALKITWQMLRVYTLSPVSYIIENLNSSVYVKRVPYL